MLRAYLPPAGTVLEIASGTGQHVCYFAGELPALNWIPSEKDAGSVATLTAGLADHGCSNVLAPLNIDVSGAWPELEVDAVLTANLLHVSPLQTVRQLCRGAASVCRSGGILHVYGPFKQAGEHTSEGNAAFDVSLRRDDSRWGIRDVEAVVEEAAQSGFTDARQIAMPANNLSLVFTRQ